jgi:hypothetical protein
MSITLLTHPLHLLLAAMVLTRLVGLVRLSRSGHRLAA